MPYLKKIFFDVFTSEIFFSFECSWSFEKGKKRVLLLVKKEKNELPSDNFKLGWTYNLQLRRSKFEVLKFSTLEPKNHFWTFQTANYRKTVLKKQTIKTVFRFVFEYLFFMFFKSQNFNKVEVTYKFCVCACCAVCNLFSSLFSHLSKTALRCIVTPIRWRRQRAASGSESCNRCPQRSRGSLKSRRIIDKTFHGGSERPAGASQA